MYGAVDSNPVVGRGTHDSAAIELSGTVGAFGFASIANPTNRVLVFDLPTNAAYYGADMVDVSAQSGPAATLRLHFVDLLCQALQDETIPGSAAAFNAFPELVFYAQQSQGTGVYFFAGTITAVLEPAAALLGLTRLAAGWFSSRRISRRRLPAARRNHR